MEGRRSSSRRPPVGPILDSLTGNSINKQSEVAGPWRLANLHPDRGPSILSLPAGKQPQLWEPGSGTLAICFACLHWQGRIGASRCGQIGSGIGVTAAARIGGRWIAFDTLRPDSGPGQSLEPVSIGSIGAAQIDFVRMTWPDGVFQTEGALATGQHHQIDENAAAGSELPGRPSLGMESSLSL